MLGLVDRICWGPDNAIQCFPGALASAMRYLGNKTSDNYLMGISGGAFLTIWGLPWSHANTDMLVIGDEPVRRAFEALGMNWASLGRQNAVLTDGWKDLFRRHIVESIDRAVPVIAKGIIGPPECSLVIGYEEDGAVLHGWSYYQIVSHFYSGDPEKPFRKENWADDCFGLILIGDKNPWLTPHPRQVLEDALRWAIILAYTPEWVVLGNSGIERFRSGLAAYDAMADALLRDIDFPPGNLSVLTDRCGTIANDGIPLMEMKRAQAASFLREMAALSLHGSDALLEAAARYEQEVALLHPASEILPLTYSPEAERMRLAERSFRNEIAGIVRKARQLEEQAVACLQQALIQINIA